MLRTIKKLLGIKEKVPKVFDIRPEAPGIVPLRISPRPPLARSVSARSSSGALTSNAATGLDPLGLPLAVSQTNGTPVLVTAPAPAPFVSGGGGDFGGGGAGGAWEREAVGVTNTSGGCPAPAPTPAVNVEAPPPAPAPASYDPGPAPAPASCDSGSYISVASINPDAPSRKSARISKIRRDLA